MPTPIRYDVHELDTPRRREGLIIGALSSALGAAAFFFIVFATLGGLLEMGVLK